MFKEIGNPDLYHGSRKKGTFFEGWYFKLVDREYKNAVAFIPGIYKSADRSVGHSFIQVLNGNICRYDYLKFKSDEFLWKRDRLDISIGENRFSLEGLQLDVKSEGLSIKGSLKFSDMLRWKDSLLNPGSMGYYNYFTFMECYSQVCTLSGRVEGQISYNDEMIDFSGGSIYIEKNWGRSFPQSWIWIQSNSFSEHHAALTCSSGRVPFLTGSFYGFLVGFQIGKEFYSFTTMNKSRMNIEQYRDDVAIEIANNYYCLKIRTESDKASYMKCMGPDGKSMRPLVDECLDGKVYVELRKTGSKEIKFRDVGFCTGIEYGGSNMFKN